MWRCSELSLNGLDQQLVLVVDDNEFNREGLVLYLQNQGMRTVEAGDEQAGYEAAIRYTPALAVIDIVIPPREGVATQTSQSFGLSLVRRLKEELPEMGIVVFSAYEDRGSEIWSLVRDGTRGIAYLLKGTRPARLLQHLEETRAGHVILDPDAMTDPRRQAIELRAHLSEAERPWVEWAVAQIGTLSPREYDVAQRLAASHNTTGIAESFGISPRTVEHHVGNLYTKLGLSDVEEKAPSLRKSMLLAKACMLYELMEHDALKQTL